MYFDTAYVARFYLNEPGSDEVRNLATRVTTIRSSAWVIPELHSVLHRKIRERSIQIEDGWRVTAQFASHVDSRFWSLVPVGDRLLHRTARLLVSAPSDLFLRSADAAHLATAAQLGETEIWTNDRHMIAAAPYFGLKGRSLY